MLMALHLQCHLPSSFTSHNRCKQLASLSSLQAPWESFEKGKLLTSSLGHLAGFEQATGRLVISPNPLSQGFT